MRFAARSSLQMARHMHRRPQLSLLLHRALKFRCHFVGDVDGAAVEYDGARGGFVWIQRHRVYYLRGRRNFFISIRDKISNNYYKHFLFYEFIAKLLTLFFSHPIFPPMTNQFIFRESARGSAARSREYV